MDIDQNKVVLFVRKYSLNNELFAIVSRTLPLLWVFVIVYTQSSRGIDQNRSAVSVNVGLAGKRKSLGKERMGGLG